MNHTLTTLSRMLHSATSMVIATLAYSTASCATHAAIERVDSRFSLSSGNTASIGVSRDPGGVCSSSLVHVLIDGEQAGDVGPAETLKLYVTPGMHVVEATANARCLPDVATQYITAGDSQPVSLKVAFDFFGHIAFAR